MTFLFTDVVGSTPLWDRYPEDMAEALAIHDRVVRDAIASHDGQIFSTAGDSFAAAFASASAAIAAGLLAQESLGAQVWPGEVSIQVRMGADTGEAYERDGDYFGPVVNRAARLMGAANGGQFVVSGLTAVLAPARSGVHYVDLGEIRVKGIVEPIDVVGVAGPSHPWIDTRLVADQAAIGNLRRPQTEFIGDLAVLRRRVAGLGENRLVTLTGSGGVGKTRAATEIGLLVVEDFPGGVWMCEFAPLSDPDAVVAAVIESIGARPQAGLTGIDVIVDWCRNRQVLLILDNCEHLVGPIADLAGELAERCQSLTVLATSREPLGVPGERVVRVPSLEPAQGVELFVERASALDSEFWRAQDWDSIEAICRRLDGIPLAIELAAARVRSLSPDEILERLDERFRLLRGSGRGGLERHQTLQAAVEWSYRLLSVAEQNLFATLSVFAGSFDLDAVEGVCDGDGDVLGSLADLVDKSMVVAERSGRRTRYRLLETLRQYAEQRLADRDATADARERHLAYYASAAEGAARLASTRQEMDFVAFFDIEWDNIRAAFTWALASDDLARAEQLLLATAGFAEMRMRFEHGEWAVELAELGDRLGRPSALAFAVQACWATQTGQPTRAVELAEIGLGLGGSEVDPALCNIWRVEALMISGRTGDARQALDRLRDVIAASFSTWMTVKAWSAILNVALGAGDRSSVEEVERAGGFYHGTGSAAVLSQLFFNQAHIALYSNDPPDFEGARELYARAAAAAAEVESVQQRLWSEFGMVNTSVIAGRPEVGPEIRDVLQASHDLRYWVLTLAALETAQWFHARRGALEVAATILGFLETIPAPWEAVTAPFRREVSLLVADETGATEWKQRGKAMDRHEMVDFTLDSLRD